MDNKHWLEKYNELNNSYKEKLVFRFGTGSGFFSEFNHMVFAILYCLHNKIKFTLSSNHNNLSIQRGWQDFFLPFCDEDTSSFHVLNNLRSYQYLPSTRWRAKIFLYKKVFGINFFTQDLWENIRGQSLNNIYSIPELGINENLLESCIVIVNNIWRYNSEIEKELSIKLANISLPQLYSGVHIRSGDKSIEHKLFSPSDYINRVKDVSSCKDVFIATDSYDNIITLKAYYPDYNFYTICKPSASGHLQASFDSQSSILKRESMLDLFCDIEALCASHKFFGTYSSNIGMYIAMRAGEAKCYCLDFDNWIVW